MIIVISGPPCSGKSALGGLLAARRGITHLEMDAIRVRLMPNSAHTREDREIAYRAMHLAAEVLLRHGLDVIVNASYSHPEDRREVRQIASATCSPLCFVECTVPREIALERNRQRRAHHPGLDLTDERVTELVRNFPFSGEGLTVDSTEPVESNLRQLEDYMAEFRGVGHAVPPQAVPPAKAT